MAAPNQPLTSNIVPKSNLGESDQLIEARLKLKEGVANLDITPNSIPICDAL